MDSRKLLSYLLLNVLVSACVTGAILFWYDRNYRATLAPVVAPPGSGQVAAGETLSPQTDIPVQIESVVGAGTLNAETTVIHYSGQEQLNLAGWQLKDENSNTFTFPQLTLYQNGSVQVHSASGTDTVIDLYWGMPEAVWGSGENARLYDPQGSLRAVYRVP
ncbi:MAG: lamin tail domain-containing protein [Bacteroidota bacterium]